MTLENKEFKLYSKFINMTTYENELRGLNIRLIGGIDEAGRGPLAGPVVASCVILPNDFYLPGLDDSKKLSVKKRELFFTEIQSKAIGIGIGIVDVNEIDEYNIYQATKIAMTNAISNLIVKPEHLLIDAMTLDIDIPQTSIIKGDQKSISIAAASIIAKVTRDHYMDELDKIYPEYHFKNNKGYGTKEHLEAIKKYGITNVHRKTFEPIKSMLIKN
ncbi:MAG TPA: ribonuclease HII [Haloplasmataceae bacterium]